MGDFWLENAASPGRHLLLDVGYVKDAAARERADRVIAVVGKSHKRQRNGMLAGFGRILIRIPPERLDALLSACPSIEAPPGYVWTTHRWLPPGSENVELAGG